MPDMATRFPFTDVRRFLDEMREDDWSFGRLFPSVGGLGLSTGMPPVDVVESNGKYVVKASLPGFKREEINVQVGEGVLTISAKRSEEKEETGENFIRRERYAGSLMRRLPLSGITSASVVDAALKDGVLQVTVSVPEDHQAKQIEIREG